MRSRFFEVILFAVGILSTVALFLSVAFVPFFYIAVSGEDAFLLCLIVAMVSSIIFGSIWVVHYIVYGKKYNFSDIVNLIFGNVPHYFVFIGSILTLGGIVTAIKSGSSDEVLWWGYFGEGVGAALAIIIIGLFGRLYSKNRFAGHVVSTIIVGIASIIVMLQ